MKFFYESTNINEKTFSGVYHSTIQTDSHGIERNFAKNYNFDNIFCDLHDTAQWRRLISASLIDLDDVVKEALRHHPRRKDFYRNLDELTTHMEFYIRTSTLKGRKNCYNITGFGYIVDENAAKGLSGFFGVHVVKSAKNSEFNILSVNNLKERVFF
ncbi:hypothetical protein E8L99_20130 [Phreatobacter aquaticus]|uniref:Uncharacterized protein n=1 Tax=Phreatobacter aquaticus TaxID=2570229 RepID=A0A4D7QSD4_9HYPH|nr:hypothetical protein [Phreatobacter aquaticus]QCK87897.1 hypothetical protein E8L99_20130 [Phreatobacter aquaticus]